MCKPESNEDCPVHDGVLKLHVKLCCENHAALLLRALIHSTETCLSSDKGSGPYCKHFQV